MAKTYPIDNPPGGSLTCSDDQMGIVDVIGGSVYAQCVSVPGTATKDNDEVKAAQWLMAASLVKITALINTYPMTCERSFKQENTYIQSHGKSSV